MNYWLVKSEPKKYSWEQFLKDGQTFWDGVRNYQARNNLKLMALGDKVFFYHSNEGKEIVGLAEVIKTAYQDPTTEDINWVVVDIKPVTPFKNTITLKAIKENYQLKNIALIKQSRLSVMPISTLEYAVIIKIGGIKK